MGQRQRHTRVKRKVAAKRAKHELDDAAKWRVKLLIDLGIEQQAIADSIDATQQTVSRLILGRGRSIGLYEPRIVEYLRQNGAGNLTCSAMGWPENDDAPAK